MSLSRLALGWVLVVATAACGHAALAPPTPPVVTPPVTPAARASFDAALRSFVTHDRAGNWTAETCAEVAAAFEAVANEHRLGEASYDAGLTWQRCHDDFHARADFEEASARDPKLVQARVQVSLYRFKADANLDAAISSLTDTVVLAQFRDVTALVSLAALQLQRDRPVPGVGCASDADCAKLNLTRALAIDDANMPAMNQLALFYYRMANKRASVGKSADAQQLELAALVCSQAIRKDPSYAPIHNTAGLVANGLGQVNVAVTEFATAARLDPKLFEAQMNLALVNLSFRGFAQAEVALRKALELRPNDYDAHLALALALRGQIVGTGDDAQIAAIDAELDQCRKIDTKRPDAWYNAAILTHEYKAKAATSPSRVIVALVDAKALYAEFLALAKDRPDYDAAIKRTRGDGKLDRGVLGDIEDTIAFIRAGSAATPNTLVPAAPPPLPPLPLAPTAPG